MAVADLRQWWHAFAPQLEVAMRKGLVRVAWSQDDPKNSKRELEELFAWHERIKASVPLLIWADELHKRESHKCVPPSCLLLA